MNEAYTWAEWVAIRDAVAAEMRATGDKRQGSSLLVAAEKLITSGVIDVARIASEQR